MTFNELLPVLKGNHTVTIYDKVGEVVDCGDCRNEDPEKYCFETMTNLSRIIGDRKVVSVIASKDFAGLDITFE